MGLEEIGDEALVLRVVHVVAPLRRVAHADHRRADRLDDVFVGREARPEQLDRLGQARVGELLDEIDPHAAGQEDEHGVRLGRADLRQFGAVVELAHFGVDLVDHLALVGALEAVQVVLAARVVRGQQHDVLEALLGHHLADRLVEVVVLPGDVEEEGIALRAGVLRGAGVGADVVGLRGEHARADRQHHVREHDPGHEVDLFLFDQAVGHLLGHVRVLLVVAGEHLDRQVAHLVAEVFERELEAVADVDAQTGAGAGQGRQHPDFDLVGSLGIEGGAQGEQCGG